MTVTSAPEGKLHLHIDNDNKLGPVFEVSRERLDAAFERYPELKDKLHCTIDYDCENFEQHIATAGALVCWKFDLANLAERAPNLKWIHVTGAGIEYYTPFDWLPEGVTFTNNRGVHGARADEYTIMAVLMLNNRLPQMVTSQRKGTWCQEFNTGIAGKTLLVIGVGNVGGGVAAQAKHFGMNVLGVRRTVGTHPSVDEMHGPDAIPDLVPRADYIIVTAPSTANTQHLIGAKEIAAMRPGSGLVNYSRAQVVDYEALRQRLTDPGDISAILDVFDPEPLPDASPLWQTPNLIITPHCSSDDTDVYIPRTLDLFFDNMRRYFAGQDLVNRVDPVLEY